ncbi:MAG: succinylglutamate desuccinylase/aspartoacylase family protein [Burkholderiaceae bacterium]
MSPLRTEHHPLLSDTPGTARQVTSHHFGHAGARPRVYIQAGLHAGEIPGMLVTRHLLPLLEALEVQGRLAGEVVVVPVANPVGLAQGLLHDSIGRFEMHAAENFNRHYPDLVKLLGDTLDGALGDSAQGNTALVRHAMADALAASPAATELASLRKTLLGLALGADMVLDLHCDLEAVCHLYTTDTSRDWGLQLSAHLGARVVLLASESGGHAFDESCSTPWDQLRARYGGRHPIAVGCHAATVELRGLADVDDIQAAADARHLAGWLAAIGRSRQARAAPPAFAPGDGVPLAGTDDIKAPFGGIVSFRRAIGERVKAGEVIADLVDPLTGERTEITTRNDGLFYAREHRRFLRRGTSIGQVSGATPIRDGYLLAAR